MRWGALVLGIAACGGGGGNGAADASHGADARAIDATPAPDAMPLGNRDRLIRSYHARLQEVPDAQQMNGLTGNQLPDVCALWTALSPSAQQVFLTITHRLEGATLPDGTNALDHLERLYRLDGGDGSTATDDGSCGGEGNRMFFTMDATLHDAFAGVHAGTVVLHDVAPHADWRDSHDAAGPHTPFTESDETNDGAPRGQTQYFVDVSSTEATSPLGRRDVEDVVDPYALEIDQDYDCTHNSNPSCSYTFYGPLCAPETSQDGTAIYTANYGDYDAAWTPLGC
jgi:hypothetical protein